MPSSGAVIHMLCHGTKGPPDEPPRHGDARRKQMIEAFIKSVWPFQRRDPQISPEGQNQPPADAGDAP